MSGLDLSEGGWFKIAIINNIFVISCWVVIKSLKRLVKKSWKIARNCQSDMSTRNESGSSGEIGSKSGPSGYPWEEVLPRVLKRGYTWPVCGSIALKGELFCSDGFNGRPGPNMDWGYFDHWTVASWDLRGWQNVVIVFKSRKILLFFCLIFLCDWILFFAWLLDWCLLQGYFIGFRISRTIGPCLWVKSKLNFNKVWILAIN